ncbi:MAG: hypothetical protein N2593_00070 [Patescibacteria group bacterium]|nr:hypothetical protein [Patescibacteria group bacterium]
MTKLKHILEKLEILKNNKNTKKNYKKIFLNYFFYFFLILFLISNMFFSQNINSLFIKIVNFEKKPTIEFLKKIAEKPYFEKQLLYFENIFQESLKNSVFKEKNELNDKIKKLEQILEKNPKSRDVLYSLSVLYHQKKDEKKANEYFQKAKEIDPLINN